MLNPVGHAEINYNQAHIQTRNTVERCFGVWKRRFPVLAYGCRLKLDNILAVIVATGVLHNIAMKQNENIPPAEDENNLNNLIMDGQIPQIPQIRNDGAAEGMAVRNDFIANYFSRL